jgi:hypothetical protein
MECGCEGAVSCELTVAAISNDCWARGDIEGRVGGRVVDKEKLRP